MHIERRTLPHRLDSRCIDAMLKAQRARKVLESRRSSAIEAQLDAGVPLALALRIVDGELNG